MYQNHLTPEEREAVNERIIELLTILGFIPPESNSMEVDHHE